MFVVHPRPFLVRRFQDLRIREARAGSRVLSAGAVGRNVKASGPEARHLAPAFEVGEECAEVAGSERSPPAG